jgi:hypothetical protein
MVPHAPGRSGPRHALVLRIGSTRVAVPAQGGQTLLKCREPTIRGTSAKIVISTPRIVLGCGGLFKADESRKHTKDEEGKPHGNLSPGQDGG